MPYELRISIQGGRAQATLNTDESAGGQYGPEDLRYDQLRGWTIRTLQGWLPRWYAIHAIGHQMLVTDTLEVLGRHLYAILFNGGIETAFRDGLNAAQRSDERLRVLLQFSPDSVELARLPWEFLYQDEGATGEEGFLALKTDFMLNRTLGQTTGRARFDPAEPPLDVLVILALPHDRPVADVRNVLEEVGKDDGEDVGKTPQLRVTFVEAGENLDELKAALKQDPQVVHFVGHARYQVGQDRTEIELPSADGRYGFRSAESFVSLLQREKAKELPRLVFLHLRDRGDSDFSANFERLAPALIRAKIPLVLAMQYPIPESATKRFLTTLYGDLASGEEFDYAVQNARACMYVGEGDISPFLGTPVLYMQSASSRLVRPPSPEDLTHEPPGVRVSTQPTGLQGSLKDTLMKLAIDTAGTSQDADALMTWVDEVDWTEDAARNQRFISQQLRNDPRFKERRGVYSAMIEAVRSSGGRA